MSRGLGRIEKYILNEIKEKEYCYMCRVPGLQPAVSRAARRLIEKNLVSWRIAKSGTIDKRRFAHGLVYHSHKYLFPPSLTEYEIDTIMIDHCLGNFPYLKYMRKSPEERAAKERELFSLARSLMG
jgi:hypothetical protein